LQSNSLLLENLVNRSNDAIFVIDPETGSFLHVNDKACSNLGYEYNELLHLSVPDVEASIRDRSAWKEHVKEVKRNGYMLLQGKHKRKGGTTFPVEINVKYIRLEEKAYMIAVARDITARRNAEEYLRQSEERFRLAMLGATDGLWDRNLLTDEIYYSPRWKTMLGYADEELANHLDTWKGLLHPEDREPTLALVRDFLEGRADKYEAEFRLRHKDGHYIDILSRGSLIRGINGEALRFVGTHVDITERKQTEEQIMALNKQLKQKVAKLDAANKELEAFSYSVSHDLRAPLRHMSGFMKLLQKKLGDYPDVETRDYMASIVEASKKMDMLIDDLLAFSRIARVEMRKKKVSLKTLVKAAIGDIRSETKARDIIWDIDELPDVYGDQSMLSLVLANLISNAVKYTSTRSRAEIKIGYKEDKEEFIFSVKDNGVGFDMKYADKLFCVFQRLHTQNEFEGNGIGLSIVQRIIARHDGRVWAESAVGQGAAFYFALPKVKET
jgi:PAS domain S-box-containing protein